MEYYTIVCEYIFNNPKKVPFIILFIYFESESVLSILRVKESKCF